MSKPVSTILWNRAWACTRGRVTNYLGNHVRFRTIDRVHDRLLVMDAVIDDACGRIEEKLRNV